MALRETNLIPSEIVARRTFLRHLGFWAGCMVISLSLIWGFYFCQVYALQAKRRTLAELKQKHQDLGNKINEMRRIQAELDRMRQEQAGLENITLVTPYSHIFAKLADIMNKDTWLTQLIIDCGLEKDSQVGLRLTGFSFSAEQLGNFLNQLTKDTMFKGVLLQQLREYEGSQFSGGSTKPIRLIKFNIECNVSKV